MNRCNTQKELHTIRNQQAGIDYSYSGSGACQFVSLEITKQARVTLVVLFQYSVTAVHRNSAPYDFLLPLPNSVSCRRGLKRGYVKGAG